MSCPTMDDAPWFGIVACSRQGTCDNLTSLCACNNGFSGGGDLFDLRVSMNETQSLDCGLSLLGVEITWSITLFFVSFRQLTSVVALLLQLRRQKSKVSRSVLQVLLADVFIVHPIFFALTVLKALYRQVIGTDPAVTILFALGVPIAFFTINHYTVHQFSLLQLSPDSALSRRYARTAYLAPILYFLFASIPTLCSLALDKGKGPVASGQVVILIFRILMVCVFQVIGLRNAVLFANEARAILHTQSMVASDSVIREKVMRVVDFMNAQATSLKKRCIVLLVLHIPFLTPYLWQQQALLIGISVVLISFSNPALSMLRMRWASRSVESSSGGREGTRQLSDDHSNRKVAAMTPMVDAKQVAVYSS